MRTVSTRPNAVIITGNDPGPGQGPKAVVVPGGGPGDGHGPKAIVIGDPGGDGDLAARMNLEGDLVPRALAACPETGDR